MAAKTIPEVDETTELLEAIEAQNRVVTAQEQRVLATKERLKEDKEELDQAIFSLRRLCGSRDETPLLNADTDEE